nr:Rv2231c family pyridoxal phosphate-dependent protein CobC [Rhodococcus kroppenstedtii]
MHAVTVRDSLVPVSDAHDPDLRHHGDVDAEPGMEDFAVNVRGTRPPEWLRAILVDSLGRVGSYPSAEHDRAVREVVAARHGRHPDEVLLLAGAAEGFAMLPRLVRRRAAVIHPSFTEPEFALREAGVPTTRVILSRPYVLAAATVPEDADVVVVGNPTNPTSVLHPRRDVLAMRRPGRLVVVDEAFADTTPGEPESLAGESYPDVLVLRSLTKSFALAGLRCGYALGHPDVLARLTRGRAHWPLGTLQLDAVAACSSPEAVRRVERDAAVIADERTYLIDRLATVGVRSAAPPSSSFVLVDVPDAERVRRGLRARGVAVRRCDTFPGLGDQLRLAVRDRGAVDRLVTAWHAVTLGP